MWLLSQSNGLTTKIRRTKSIDNFFRGVAMALNWILGNFSLNSLKSEAIEFSDNWESGQEKVL